MGIQLMSRGFRHHGSPDQHCSPVRSRRSSPPDSARSAGPTRAAPSCASTFVIPTASGEAIHKESPYGTVWRSQSRRSASEAVGAQGYRPGVVLTATVQGAGGSSSRRTLGTGRRRRIHWFPHARWTPSPPPVSHALKGRSSCVQRAGTEALGPTGDAFRAAGAVRPAVR